MGRTRSLAQVYRRFGEVDSAGTSPLYERVAVALVPRDALPVVTTTWALSHFPLESRLRFLHRLDEAAAGRPVAWLATSSCPSRSASPDHGRADGSRRPR